MKTRLEHFGRADLIGDINYICPDCGKVKGVDKYGKDSHFEEGTFCSECGTPLLTEPVIQKSCDRCNTPVYGEGEDYLTTSDNEIVCFNCYKESWED